MSTSQNIRIILIGIYLTATLNAVGQWNNFNYANNAARMQAQQIHRQAQQIHRQAQQMNYGANIQPQRNQLQQVRTNTNINIPAGFFTFTKLTVDKNAILNGRRIIKCQYVFTTIDGRLNPIRPVVTLESPQGTVHTGSDGPLKFVGDPINIIGFRVGTDGWGGFYEDCLNLKPGTHTYYFSVKIYSERTGSYVAQSNYVPVTLTGTSVQPVKKEIAQVEETRPEVTKPVQEEQQEKTTRPAGALQDENGNQVHIPLKAINKTSIKNVNEGSSIDFEVAMDVVINGVKAIPKGAIAKGMVTNVKRSKKSGFMSITDGKEEFTYQLTTVFLPDGQQIPLYREDITVSGQNSNYDLTGVSRAAIKKGTDVIGKISSAYHIPQKSLDKSIVISKESTPLIVSDVDQNIPQTDYIAENTFAVIIANENYSNEADVENAINDGRAFKKYCRKTLGLPDLNIHYSENATKNDIIREIDWVSEVASAFGKDAKIIIYYAGHGIPDEQSHTSYLLPVDGIGNNIKTGYSLDVLYKQLSALPANSIFLFMDACFSGTKRGEGMLAQNARGVAIKAKTAQTNGNLVVMTAAQGDETAYPYKEKGHGLFTYFLLKKLQQSKGDCSILELSNFVKQQVSRRSIIVNKKSQTPTISASPTLGNSWQNMKLR